MSQFKGYSYKNQNDKVFLFEYEGENVRVTFKISPVNNNIAVLQFINNENDQVVIQPPQGFTVRTYPAHIPIAPFNNGFFVTWVENYELLFGEEVIWSLTNQKQQAYKYCDNYGGV